MAASLIGQSIRGSRHRRGGGRFTDINVTPLVDVMLVLLIVFMVTAPLLAVGVPVDLPKTQAATMNERDEPLVITVNAAGSIFIQETEVAPEQLVPRLEAITRNKPDLKIYVRGDRTVAYGRIMEVMGLISVAGYSKVALLAELPPQSGEQPRRRR
jgi:biopolymer transport protein TolR